MQRHAVVASMKGRPTKSGDADLQPGRRPAGPLTVTEGDVIEPRGRAAPFRGGDSSRAMMPASLS
jgi:hypothetical protein